MSSVLVFGPIARIAEGLSTAWILARVRLLSCVGSKVSLQIFQSGVRFEASFEL